MYRQIIDKLNQFLNYIHIPGTPLNSDAFQGILVKKLSNQNIIKDKRRINAGDTSSTVNQTHIDVTGKHTIDITISDPGRTSLKLTYTYNHTFVPPM